MIREEKKREPGRASLIAAECVSLDEGRFSAHSAAIKHSHGEAIITDDGSDTCGFQLEENALSFVTKVSAQRIGPTHS